METIDCEPEVAAVDCEPDVAAVEAADCADEAAELWLTASCERVTKSCWAAERSPLLRSCPSCLNSVRNWEIAFGAKKLVLETPAVDMGLTLLGKIRQFAAVQLAIYRHAE